MELLILLLMVRDNLIHTSDIDLNKELCDYIKRSGWVSDNEYKRAVVNPKYPGWYLFISDERGSSIPGKLYQITDLKFTDGSKEDAFIVPYGSTLLLLLRPALMDTSPGIDLIKFLLEKELKVIDNVLNPKQGAAVIAAEGAEEKVIIDPYVKCPG